MFYYGQYLRHFIGALVGSLIAFLASKGISVTPDVQQGLSLLIFGILYSFTEKYLKRFSWLDPKGFADKTIIEAKAASLEKQGKI